MRGRKPLHPNLHIIRGTARRDRAHPAKSGTPIKDTPQCPDWIASERGKIEFRRLVATLRACNALTAENLPDVELAAGLHGRIADCLALDATPMPSLIAQLRALRAGLGLSGLRVPAESERENPFARNGKLPA